MGDAAVADTSTEPIDLDPPNELTDLSCMSSDLITTSCSRLPSCLQQEMSRQGSGIGTLTSWQLLARQVGNTEQEEEDEASPTPSGLHKPSAVSAELLCSPRSASWTSGVQRIAPRPHQTLYKEYRLLETIGKGAFGTVNIAIRRADGKQLVAKEIAFGQASLASTKQRDAIMGEVNVLARLKHPNIVRYHDCFMDSAYLIIIMEYCNAGDLAGLIKKQAGQLLPEKHVMFLFIQICLAMQHVHAAGVLHRDLKTSNILATKPNTGATTPRAATPGTATPTGSPRPDRLSSVPASDDFGSLPILKLADFGVAKAGCDTDGSMAGTTVGTPHYLSPEMCEGKRYGKKTDMWALGCILYELCSLKKAFEASNIGGIYRKIAAAEYAPLPDVYSSGLSALVRSLLAKETKDRPSVSEVLNTPYVRQHLGAYLDWARSVPEAQPEVLLASISQSADGATTPRSPGTRAGSLSPLAPAGSSRAGKGSGTLEAHSGGTRGLPPSGAAAVDSTWPGSPIKPPPLLMQHDEAATQAGGDPARRMSAPADPQQLQHQQLKQAALMPHSPTQAGAPTGAGQLSTAHAVNSPWPSLAASPDTAASPAAAVAAAALAAAAAANMLEGQPTSSSTSAGPPAAVRMQANKPNPFFLAAAALAANQTCTVQPYSGAGHAEGAAVQLQHLKKKLPVGGGSCSLDIWASAHPTSSEGSLIAAFHHTGSLEGCSSDGIRRVSSAHSSPLQTPKSPLGQHMYSCQQAAAQEQDQGSQPLSEAGSFRSTSGGGAHCLPTVPLPWLAAGAGATGPAPCKHQSSSDNWLVSLVQSLESLQQEAAAHPAPAPASTAAPTAYGGLDPSMAAINKGGLVAAGLVPASTSSRRPTAEQAPTSLQGWLSGDGNLLQALQKRTHTRSASYSGSLPSPLGGAMSPGTAFLNAPASRGYVASKQTPPDSTSGSSWFSNVVFESGSAAAAGRGELPAQAGASSTAQYTQISIPEAAAPSSPRGRCLPTPLDAQVHVGSTTSGLTSTAASADAAGAASSYQQPQPAPAAASTNPTPSSIALCTPLPAVAYSAGAAQHECDDADQEDDLPLAVMVKQCLSGNSFMYTRKPGASQQTAHNAPVSRGDSRLSDSNSGQHSASSNSTDASAGSGQQQADQADARMLAEQQDAVRCFNAFRATLGVRPGKDGVMVCL